MADGPSPAAASPAPALLCEADPVPNVSISRRRSLALRAARPSLSTPPDLSHIDEDADGASDHGEDLLEAASPPVLEGLREENSHDSTFSPHQRLPTPRSSPDSSLTASPTTRNVQLVKLVAPAEPVPQSADEPVASTSALDPPPPTGQLQLQPSEAVRRGARASWAVLHSQAKDAEKKEEEATALGQIERRAKAAKAAAAPKPRPSSKGKGKAIDGTLAEERRALREVQKEEVLPQRRRTTVLVPVSSSESEAEVAPARRRSPSPPPPPPEEAQSPPALDDSSAAEEDSYVPRPTARRKAGTAQAVAPTSPDRRLETVVGSAGLQRTAQPVTKMESLGEEARPARPLPAEEPTEGRRARKSVNYALPKLNSKMRRPEDYVPAIKGARKSVVPRAPASRQSVQPTSSSQPERAAVREQLARPSSSQPASKPTSRRSAWAEESQEEGSEEEEQEEVVVERIKQRRASSLAATKAMREMQEKMREDNVGVARPAGRRQSGLA